MLGRHRKIEEENINLKNVLLLVLGSEKFVGTREVRRFVVVCATNKVEEVVYVREHNDEAEVNLAE